MKTSRKDSFCDEIIFDSLFCFLGGCNIEGEEDGWDFGTGAGFYIDATEDKWKTNYRMFSYITKEVWLEEPKVKGSYPRTIGILILPFWQTSSLKKKKFSK